MDSRSNGIKRIKERYIADAINLVQQWRELFKNGIVDIAGTMKKITLQESANIIGISKKTLQDYELVISKFTSLGYDLNDFRNEKMGKIRKIVKQQKYKVCDRQFQQNENMEESSEESIEKPHIISSFSEIEENYNLINKIVEFEFGEVQTVD